MSQGLSQFNLKYSSDAILCCKVQTDLIQHTRTDPALLQNLGQLVQIGPNFRLRMDLFLEMPVKLCKFSIFGAHRSILQFPVVNLATTGPSIKSNRHLFNSL